jgi:hypothetical protein
MNPKDNVTNAIMDKFQFNIENTSDQAVRLALLTAHHDCTGNAGLNAQNLMENGNKKRRVTPLIKAGYPVDVVLDDDEVLLSQIVKDA